MNGRTGHFEVRPNHRIFGKKPNRTTEYSAEPISTKYSAEPATFLNFPPLFNNFTGNFKVWNQIMVINSKIANMFLQCFHGQNNFNFSIRPLEYQILFYGIETLVQRYRKSISIWYFFSVSISKNIMILFRQMYQYRYQIHFSALYQY